MRADELTQSQWQRIALLVGDRKSTVILLALSSVIAALCESGVLAVSARAATALVDHSAGLHGSFGPLKLDMSVRELLLIGVGLAAARLALQAPIAYLPALIAGDVQATMRERLIEAYSRASWALQSTDREGYFQEMMTNQIQQASTGAAQATGLIVAVSTFLIMVGSAFALNLIAAGAVFGAAAVLAVALRPANALAMRFSRRLSAAQLQYAGTVGEANRVSEEVNVYGVSEALSVRVVSYVQAARALYIRSQLVGRLVPNVYQSLIYFVLILGLLAISEANLTGFASLGAIVLLLVRAGAYGQMAQTFWIQMRQSLPYVERLQDAIAVYSRSPAPQGDQRLERIERMRFDHVEYHYRADRPVLHGLSFDVRGGETIGVIGPSGAGKSTMMQILLRLREPSSGRFLINGIDATSIRPADWHARISYVPQAPKLIHASVADNVRFFRDYEDAAVQRACRLARIHDEIMSWPDGYDTIVGPRADAVSGGQQQRICLARALVSRPTMLVLDEPTSALDPRSEALIQESLEALHDDLTLFIIAHRMSTLSICNRVMIILDGRLDAIDTLDELTAHNDYYRLASGLSAAPIDPTVLAGEIERPRDPDPGEPLAACVANGAGAHPDGHSDSTVFRARAAIEAPTRPADDDASVFRARPF